ncbi:MAG: hypothetical protein PHI23_02235 [Candidatus Peribacteraceae bacterium]|nr:hypothetical protein [Candidatus Peribacteraceae bacterium]
MRLRLTSPLGQAFLLAGFALLMVGVWMVPVLLAGFPYELPTTVLRAKAFAETGVVDEAFTPAVTLILWALHPLVAWQNMMGWAAVSAAAMAAALLLLWWSVKRLFDRPVAWLTVVIFSFMPLYWTEAVLNGGYPYALFFLFLGFALFLKFFARHRLVAVLLSGICFGFVLACQHAFITFLPWFVVAFLWMHRCAWKRASLEAALFCAIAYSAFVFPLLPNALQSSLSPAERMEVFLPSVAKHATGMGHLYPDEYTYTFLRDTYDQRVRQRDAAEPFLVRQQERYIRVIFDVGDLNILDNIENGVWLFLQTLPQLVLQEYLGGAFLWLFIVPGVLVLWMQRRSLLLLMAGLWLSMEVILRFLLHYGRTHLMDIGWAPAIFAGVGVVFLCQKLQNERRHLSVPLLSTFVALVMVMQLTQANRKLFAQEYARSPVPAVYAATEALALLSSDAVVAHPRGANLFYFSDRRSVVLATETLDLLVEQGKVRDPFAYYGVTHILGYDEEYDALIKKAVPQIQVVTLSESKVQVPLTPFVRYLLHLIR